MSQRVVLQVPAETPVSVYVPEPTLPPSYLQERRLR
jgi:hypothetical protein